MAGRSLGSGVWLLLERGSMMGSLFFCSFTVRIVMGASLYIGGLAHCVDGSGAYGLVSGVPVSKSDYKLGHQNV